jgi:hypothetical protein
MLNTNHEEMFELKSQSPFFAVLMVLLAYPVVSSAYSVSFTPFVVHPNETLGWLHTDPLFEGVLFKFREYDSFLNFESQSSFSRAELDDYSINFTDLNTVPYPGRDTFGIETNHNVTVTSFFEGENKLVMDIYGTGTSTINLYGLSDLGEPTEVQGASFVYSGGVLVLTTPITDFTTITIWWTQNFINQYFPLMIFIVGFVCFFLPLGIIFWRRPDPATCIKLIMVSFIGFAVLMFSGSA